MNFVHSVPKTNITRTRIKVKNLFILEVSISYTLDFSLRNQIYTLLPLGLYVYSVDHTNPKSDDLKDTGQECSPVEPELARPRSTRVCIILYTGDV